MDFAFNKLGYNKISLLFNIHFFKTDFFNKDITMKGDKIFIFSWSLEFPNRKSTVPEKFCLKLL